MRKLIIMTVVFTLAGLSASYARGGGMHGHGAGGSCTVMALVGDGPGESSVPPSLTPDERLVGAAPLPPARRPTSANVASQEMLNKRDPEDAAIDRKIGNICRGC
jgi:hypothetical protein